MFKQIPLFDINAQTKLLKKDVLKDWSELIDSASFIRSDETFKFEESFAKLTSTKYALAVNSGSSALQLALLAEGIGKGDEVITTPVSFMATLESVIHVGAKPVLVDVDLGTGNIDPAKIEKKISPKTRAILIVHLYGVPCEMDEILKIARKHNLIVIEDASHAHGSSYKGKMVGSFGKVGCFSLYPSKIMGAFGNAGVLVTDSKKLAEIATSYAHHGMIGDSKRHTLLGFNLLMNNLQAVPLRYKLKHLKTWIAKKQAIAKRYNQVFSQYGHQGMTLPKNSNVSLYLYSVQIDKRDRFRQFLEKEKIGSGIYYQKPLHLEGSVAFLNYKSGDFPYAEKFIKRTVSIPCYPEMTEAQISRVETVIKEFLERFGRTT